MIERAERMTRLNYQGEEELEGTSYRILWGGDIET